MLIDISFDFRIDSGGKDPDIYSPTLRSYHQRLWSKVLPNSAVFNLDTTSFAYLHHRSSLGEFFLSSDSVIPTYRKYKSMQSIITKFQEGEIDQFLSLGYTIGGMMIFPGNRIQGKMTINGERGFNQLIADRMDLTLECIRRHYKGDDSPLKNALARYSEFFTLFGDFGGYVNFFLLNDLVDKSGNVKFFLPFNDFTKRSLPHDLETYINYMQKSIDFINARNERIHDWTQT